MLLSFSFSWVLISSCFALLLLLLCCSSLFHLVSLLFLLLFPFALSFIPGVVHSSHSSSHSLILCLREERENKKRIRWEEGLKEWENEWRGNPCLLFLRHHHHLVSLHPLLLTLLLDLLVILKPVIAFSRIPCHCKKSDLRRRWLKLAKC